MPRLDMTWSAIEPKSASGDKAVGNADDDPWPEWLGPSSTPRLAPPLASTSMLELSLMTEVLLLSGGVPRSDRAEVIELDLEGGPDET